MMSSFKLSEIFYSKVLSVTVFVVALLASVLVCFSLERGRVYVERTRISNIGSVYAEAITQHIERSLAMSHTMAALIRQDHGNFDDFQSMATELFPFYPSAHALALMPGGKLSDVFPRSGRWETLKEIDALTDPRFAPYYKRALASGKLTVSGQFLLFWPKGVAGIQGVLPVYLSPGQEASSLWGFIGITFRLSKLAELANLPGLTEKGIAYEVWWNNVDKNEKEVLISGTEKELADPVYRTIYVPSGTWTLSLMPVSGWTSSFSFSANLTVGLLFSLLLAYLVDIFVTLRINKRKLEHAAYFDLLTNLPNRRLFKDTLDEALVTVREQELIAVCYLDLDGFKPINDTLGHDAGDMVLEEIARRCEACIRSGDMVSRIGGDEFAFILRNLGSINDCQGILDRLLQEIAAPINLGGQDCRVSASVGVALYPYDGISSDDLLVYADLAMYRAKKGGKNRYYPITFSEEDDGALSSVSPSL